jgi:5'-nucleotidase
VCLLAGYRRPGSRSGSYRILISNDDGVHAPALPVLAQALKAIGEVIIVAPRDNQSGVSQALTAAPPDRARRTSR